MTCLWEEPGLRSLGTHSHWKEYAYDQHADDPNSVFHSQICGRVQQTTVAISLE